MNLIKKITKENILSFFVIICPILDIASFLFRNKFNTNISISTFIRPIIPVIVFLHIFFKEQNKKKLKLFIFGLIYFVYGIVHLYIYNTMKKDCSFGSLLHEGQYIINYSFMIMNLFIFNYTFNNTKKLQKSILISLSIYIISIYIAIITKTSSTTYIEGIGFKGWFESGNSISSILVLSIFIIMSFILNIKNKKLKIYTFVILTLTGIYLTTLIGTRVGLIGFILAIFLFICAESFCNIIKKQKINKKGLIVLICILILIFIVVAIMGSITMQRRKHLREMESTIIDNSNGEISNLTGDLTTIRNKIIKNDLEEDYMTDEQKQSILDLYNIAKKHNISNTDTRMQQLIYNCALVKNQKNIILILFGNGYLINTNELVLEMEFPAFLLNFGFIGFYLYMIPFIIIFIKAFIIMIKNLRKIDTSFIMLFLGAGLSFVLSTLSGYTFFNSSSMIIIIVINVLLKAKIKQIEEVN